MIDFSQFNSVIAMTMYFNNEETCKNAIVETRWGKGEQQDVVCPYCGEHHCVIRKDGKFRCNHDVSDKHLQAYIDEDCFRWNTRKAYESERFSDIFDKSIGIVNSNMEFVLCRAA